MSGGTNEKPSYDDLLADVETLRAENVRLRGLLGLDERTRRRPRAVVGPDVAHRVNRPTERGRIVGGR